MKIEIRKEEGVKGGQIDQTGLVLETIFQNESLFKLFSEGVCFFKAFRHHYERNTTWQHGMRFAIGVGETCYNFFPAWHGSRHWCWQNKLDGVWPVPLAKQVEVRKIIFACKLETGVTFDRNICLRPIICQNV